MILVDTSVWIDHFRHGNANLADRLERRQVLAHPFVIGELALGGLRQRDVILAAMQDMPHATVARDKEVLMFIDRHQVTGSGIGYVDAHLLVATALTDGAKLWTADKRLLGAATRLQLSVDLATH